MLARAVRPGKGVRTTLGVRLLDLELEVAAQAVGLGLDGSGEVAEGRREEGGRALPAAAEGLVGDRPHVGFDRECALRAGDRGGGRTGELRCAREGGRDNEPVAHRAGDVAAAAWRGERMEAGLAAATELGTEGERPVDPDGEG